MEDAADLEDDLVGGHAGGPVVEGAFSFAHAHLFGGC